MRDVAALAEVVVDAARLGLDLGGAEVLERYRRWRRFDTMTMGVRTDGLNRLFSNSSDVLRLVRDVGLGVVERLPSQALFIREAAGLVGEIPSCCARVFVDNCFSPLHQMRAVAKQEVLHIVPGSLRFRCDPHRPGENPRNRPSSRIPVIPAAARRDCFALATRTHSRIAIGIQSSQCRFTSRSIVRPISPALRLDNRIAFVASRRSRCAPPPPSSGRAGAERSRRSRRAPVATAGADQPVDRLRQRHQRPPRSS